MRTRTRTPKINLSQRRQLDYVWPTYFPTACEIQTMSEAKRSTTAGLFSYGQLESKDETEEVR